MQDVVLKLKIWKVTESRRTDEERNIAVGFGNEKNFLNYCASNLEWWTETMSAELWIMQRYQTESLWVMKCGFDMTHIQNARECIGKERIYFSWKRKKKHICCLHFMLVCVSLIISGQITTKIPLRNFLFVSTTWITHALSLILTHLMSPLRLNLKILFTKLSLTNFNFFNMSR